MDTKAARKILAQYDKQPRLLEKKHKNILKRLFPEYMKEIERLRIRYYPIEVAQKLDRNSVEEMLRKNMDPREAYIEYMIKKTHVPAGVYKETIRTNTIYVNNLMDDTAVHEATHYLTVNRISEKYGRKAIMDSSTKKIVDAILEGIALAVQHEYMKMPKEQRRSRLAISMYGYSQKNLPPWVLYKAYNRTLREIRSNGFSTVISKSPEIFKEILKAALRDLSGSNKPWQKARAEKIKKLLEHLSKRDRYMKFRKVFESMNSTFNRLKQKTQR